MSQNQAVMNRNPAQDPSGTPRQIGQVEQMQSALHSAVSETERLIAAVTSRLNIILRAEPPLACDTNKLPPQEYMVEMASALRSTLDLANSNNERLQSILSRAEL